MAKPKGSRGKVVAGRAAKAKRRTGPRQSYRPNVFAHDWEEFVRTVKSAILKSLNPPIGEKQVPYDAPAETLKRMAYQFVRDHRSGLEVEPEIEVKIKVKSIHIETAIDNYRQAESESNHRSLRKNFAEDPFYLVILGLEPAIQFDGYRITKSDISRFAKQLQYADRHDVPEEYLVGFLHQAGTLAQVCLKAKNPAQREGWYLAKFGGGDPTEE